MQIGVYAALTFLGVEVVRHPFEQLAAFEDKVECRVAEFLDFWKLYKEVLKLFRRRVYVSLFSYSKTSEAKRKAKDSFIS